MHAPSSRVEDSLLVVFALDKVLPSALDIAFTVDSISCRSIRSARGICSDYSTSGKYRERGIWTHSPP